MTRDSNLVQAASYYLDSLPGAEAKKLAIGLAQIAIRMRAEEALRAAAREPNKTVSFLPRIEA